MAPVGDARCVKPGDVGLTEVERIRIPYPAVIDDADIRAELQSMFALRPGYVIDEIVHRNDCAYRRRFAGQVINASEIGELLCLQAHLVEALTDITIAEVVDQIAAKQG